MPDYQKAKIYKLWSPQGEEDEVYYGSTCNDLRFRKNGHKCKGNICSSKILFEKYDDVRIELVEDYPCNNRAELNKREGHYIRENKCLNKQIPDRTQKEYYEVNKEKITEKIREYQLKNKEKRKEIDKKFYENNREKIVEQKREYYKKNREKVIEKQRERRRKKKEEALIKE